jgi:hypothetical protein
MLINEGGREREGPEKKEVSTEATGPPTFNVGLHICHTPTSQVLPEANLASTGDYSWRTFTEDGSDLLGVMNPNSGLATNYNYYVFSYGWHHVLSYTEQGKQIKLLPFFERGFS